MKVLAKHNDGHLYGDELDFLGGTVTATYHAGTLWEVLICETCEKPTVRSGRYDERFDEQLEFRVFYPKPLSLEGLPANIAAAHEAAIRVRAVDRNAYAVLMRRTLEMVCIQQNAQGSTLAKSLDDLAERGVLPPQLIEAAHSIRFLGNEGAHATGEVGEADIRLLDGLSAAVLEYVYVAPQLVAKVRERMTQGKSTKSTGQS
jgi:hypothetical protein